MNKKRLVIIISTLFVLGAVILYFCVKQWEADTSPDYIPGSVTVTFKPEYRSDRARIEAVAKSAGGTVNYDKYIQDTGWCEIHVKIGKEEEDVDKLSARPEIEYAYRSMYARGN